MYQIGEHIMYKNIGICVVEEIGKPGFSADKEKEYKKTENMIAIEATTKNKVGFDTYA